MTKELVPWVKANLATTGTEQNWLIGFSKSGIGSQDLLLKYPEPVYLGGVLGLSSRYVIVRPIRK